MASPPPSDTTAYDIKSQQPVAAKLGPYGVRVEAGKVYYWCSCGHSKNQPWCDGTHKTLPGPRKFASVRYEAKEDGFVHFCGCKQTKKPPFCDMSHVEYAKGKVAKLS